MLDRRPARHLSGQHLSSNTCAPTNQTRLPTTLSASPVQHTNPSGERWSASAKEKHEPPKVVSRKNTGPSSATEKHEPPQWVKSPQVQQNKTPTLHLSVSATPNLVRVVRLVQRVQVLGVLVQHAGLRVSRRNTGLRMWSTSKEKHEPPQWFSLLKSHVYRRSVSGISHVCIRSITVKSKYWSTPQLQ